ncbi:MAG: Na+/H+ antiporter subunit E [Firmicutes bacterium]|nr:Na+/H+ antiporter subunit E [Bacillota bacterium]
MTKRSLVLFALLLIFWIFVSGGLNFQHIAVGGLVTIAVVWFWHDLGPKLPGILHPGELLLLARCLGLLVLSIIQSNMAVAKTLLFSKPPVRPVFVMMQPPLKTNWGRILLATFITLTPGTVTVDLDPKTGEFVVHALTEETAISLFYWKMINRIGDLETYRQRRTGHVVDTSRVDDSNSSGAFSSNYRADGH